MTATMKMHPVSSWLEHFRTDPSSALDDLLRGLARVPPYERATSSEILKRVFGALAKDDPEMISLDETLCAWLDDRLHHWPMERRHAYGLPRFVTETMDALAAVWLVGLRRCGGWIQDNYLSLARWGAPLRLSQEWDLPRSLAQAAALTQHDTRLRFYWLRLCKEAVRPSERSMIDPALTGLATMQGAVGQGPNSDLIAGLVRFGEGLSATPRDQADFLRRWRTLKVRFPRTSKTWRSLWRPALADERFEASPFRTWLLESDPALAKPWTGGVSIEPPSYQQKRAILNRFRRGERESALQDAKAILDGCRRYAEATGDADFFIKTANNFGKEIVGWAPGHALEWSRSALQWAPSNAPSWSLRGTALTRLGRLDLAQTVYWEATRRLPDNAVVRNQLALLLVAKGQDREAEALFREANGVDPSNEVARVELAYLLARTGRETEAEQWLRRTVEELPDKMIARYTLAYFLVAWGRPEEAEIERQAYLKRFGQNRWTSMVDRLLASGSAGVTEAQRHIAERLAPRMAEMQPIAEDERVTAEQAELEERAAGALEYAANASRADLLFRIEQNEDALALLDKILEKDPDALYPEVVWALHDRMQRPRIRAKYQEAFGVLAPHLAAAGPETSQQHWDRLRRAFPERLPLIDLTRIMRAGSDESAVQRLFSWARNEKDQSDIFLKNRLLSIIGDEKRIDSEAPEQSSLLNAVIRREVDLDLEALGEVA